MYVLVKSCVVQIIPPTTPHSVHFIVVNCVRGSFDVPWLFVLKTAWESVYTWTGRWYIEFLSLIINQRRSGALNLNSHSYNIIILASTTITPLRCTGDFPSWILRGLSIQQAMVGVELKCQCTAAVRRQCHGYWSALSFGAIYKSWSNFRLTGRGRTVGEGNYYSLEPRAPTRTLFIYSSTASSSVL